MWQSMWPPSAFWMHGVAGDITWLIFFFFFTVLSWNLLCKEQALIRTSSQHSANIYISSNSCILHGHSVRSSKWQQIVWSASRGGGGLNYLYPTFPFLLSIFCLTSFCSIIDLSSTMMMGGWVSVQHKETAPQWDNYAENECGEIVFFNLTAITLLMFETDCILFTKKERKKKIKIGDFRHSVLTIKTQINYKSYFITCCPLLHEGSNIWMTFKAPSSHALQKTVQNRKAANVI